ncbi:MAG: LysR family transcriptional regulator [Acidaminococcus sp.]|jgi:DNA-binding transcriptional LysR family regulator|nr:LysR family transcriptional regulator [Acidaminococcus sp.]MCI2100108.1 LysR family transcriptional regulator [Acidaminococcus sp.]MCI2114385.1 LysR family transcriptional regulator [Acidaminococcus sp.]MCI2116310.1 LysR family transcriptional regulator [Acidaminococcus sp.]
MDIHIMENMLKIAEEKSITKAAKKLYLTQSALNQQLLREEKDLGMELFTRGKYFCEPTRAGLIYLEGVKKIIQVKKETYRKISDLTKNFKDTIHIGVTPVRGPDMFVHVYPIFRDCYPNISVHPHIMSVGEQINALEKGTIDMGFMALFKSQRKHNQYLELMKEEIVMAFPSKWQIDSYRIASPKGNVSISYKIFEDKPVVLLKKGTTMRPIIDLILKSQGVRPNVLFEAINPTTILEMIQANICCGFVSRLSSVGYSKNIDYYSFPMPLRWDVAVSYPSGVKLSKAELDFVDMAKNYWMGKIGEA